MKTFEIKTIVVAVVIMVMFSGCETKTTQEKQTNNTGVQNPTTQTTDDTSDGEETTNADGSTTTDGTTNTNEASNNDSTSGGNTNTVDTGATTDTNTSTGGGSDDTTTSGTDDNTTTTPTVTLSSLTLTIHKISLNKDDTTPIKVMATYSDKTSKELTDNVEWIVTPSDAIQVKNTTLTALKDKATTVKAKVGSTLSNTLNLSIAWVVNGHVLPPEPDKTLNDSTLLGIDTNDNGVRDDVERWIYEEYKDKHPIHVDIGMQAGRGYKLVLESPERAKEIHNEVDAPIACNWYYQEEAEDFNDTTLVNEDIVSKVFLEVYNTEERMNTHKKYDKLLSGATYTTPWPDEMQALCNFNTIQYKKL